MTRTTTNSSNLIGIARRRISGGFIIAGLAAAMLFAGSPSAMAQAKKVPAWEIRIIPRTKMLPKDVDPLMNVKTHVKGVSYRDVYQSIPFMRSEFNANPSYRHEATMRILFGQMFPSCCCGGQAAK